MPEQLANFAKSTLASGINNSTTSVDVNDGSNFPSSGNYRIIIGSEIMKVTARSSNNLTVVRGQEGTSGASHSSGDDVVCILTKTGLETWLADAKAFDTYANLPAAGNAGNLYITSNGNMLGVDDGSNWKFTGSPFYNGLTPPALANFTWQNQGGATAVETRGGILLTTPVESGINYRILYRSLTPPYKVTMCFVPFMADVNYPSVGLAFGNGTKLIDIDTINNSHVNYLQILKCSDVNTPQTAVSNIISSNCGSKMNWFQVEDDNTNFYFRYSPNGKMWRTYYSEGRTAYMTSPNRVGFYACGRNATYAAAIHVIHWKEE